MAAVKPVLNIIYLLNNYKIPFALTPSQLGSETVRCIIPHDISVDAAAALSVDGLGIIKIVNYVILALITGS